MQKLEKIFWIISVIGVIMNLMLLPFSSILLAISITLLSFIYYPFGFALFNRIGIRKLFKKNSYKGITVLRILGAIGIGMSLSALCLGMFFKLFNYPGGNYIIKTGLSTSLIMLPFLLFKYFKSGGDYYIRILKRIAVIGSLGLVILGFSSMTFTRIKYHNYPDYIKACESHDAHPKDVESAKKMDFEYKRMTMTKTEFEGYQQFLQHSKRK